MFKEKIHIPFLVVVVGQAFTLKCTKFFERKAEVRVSDYELHTRLRGKQGYGIREKNRHFWCG